MKIYYDVSGIYNWPHGHLTGIQRVECGILKGLLNDGINIQLIFFNKTQNTFCHLALPELPSTVLDFLEIRREIDKPTSIPKLGIKDALKKIKILRTIADFLYANEILKPPLDKRKTLSIDEKEEIWVISASASFCIPNHAKGLNQLFIENIKIVRVIYDLIPTLKPQWVTEEISNTFTNVTNYQLTHSHLILTISEFSKKEIIHYSSKEKLNSAPVEIIRLADKNTRQVRSGKKIKIPEINPFFICVCTIDPRKNHQILYDAWVLLKRKMGDKCPQLKIIGLPYLFSNDLVHFIKNDPEVNQNIEVLNQVSDDQLDWYYQNCIATIYPSKYEGWGLPIAESLGYGKLCLASELPPMNEIAPELTDFFDPYNVYELITWIEKCMFDEPWRKAREQEIISNFKPTDWETTSRRIITLLDQEKQKKLAKVYLNF